jgi:mono/diheme cytochrome c family protein
MLRNRIIIVVIITVAVITGLVGTLIRPVDGPPPPPVSQAPDPAATPDEAAAVATAGLEPFQSFCSECHGSEALGTNQGPPLIHQLYEPNHHGDGAFVAAARQGSPQHHWDFGNMLPVAQLSDGDLIAIIGYVRSLQRAAGIF